MAVRLATLILILIAALTGVARSQDVRSTGFNHAAGRDLRCQVADAGQRRIPVRGHHFRRPRAADRRRCFQDIAPGGYAGLWVMSAYVPIVEARNGDLYVAGHTQSFVPGVFRLKGATPSQFGTVESVGDFQGSVEGTPFGALVEGRDGHLYGFSSSFAEEVSAVHIYRLTVGGAITLLHTFEGATGARDNYTLMQAEDGNFYGTAIDTGPFGRGTAFKMTPAGAVTVLHQFSGR